MPYVTLAQMKAALPAKITEQLLDDQGTGVGDAAVWTEIVSRVQAEIDGRLGQRFAVPLADPVPALVADAAFVLAAELLYQRRGYFGDQNPWTARAQGIRGTVGVPGGQPGLLDKIAAGEMALTPATAAVKAPAVAITESARLNHSGGNLMA